MKTKFTCLIAGLFFLLSYANNITVSNISLENLNSPNWVQVEFDLSWENSWRLSAGPSNWDAAWVFIKYRVNSGEWEHAQLSQSNAVEASGSTIVVSSDGVGAFIYRNADGSGNVNFQDLRLRWDYGAIDPNDIIDVQVFAIEMVNVPQGAFSVGGTSGDEVNKFYSGGLATTSIPFEITSENTITVSDTPNNLYYSSTSSGAGDQSGPIPNDFPKGFDTFYVMKYEVSQSQWVDFFNTLTDTQKASNDVTGISGKNSDAEVARNGISWSDGSTNASTTFPDVALNYVATKMTSAYLDWAGLRHMTELEFEKACRGPIAPKQGEFAWGSASIAIQDYTLINDGQANELVSNPQQNTGNTIYSETNGTISGPIRVGIFAASAITKNREETGGSYYGIMELSGNLYERVITIGLPEGRNFSGLEGDGLLATSGEANETNWPLDNGSGLGYKGASWFNGSAFLRVSDRFDAATVISSGNNRLGFRGARTAE